jgi:glycosyltransferase involved in cell wall biosynthesis
MIVPAIIASGHEVAVLPLASNHINTITHAPGGVRLLPLANDPLGNDIIRYHYVNGRFDAVITFTDCWGLAPEAYKDLNWYPMAPVDTYTLNPEYKAALNACRFPIAISKFGQQVIKEQLGIEAKYFPCMVDTDVWKPGDKAAARKALGIPMNKIMFTFVGVNRDVPSRKGIPELLQAWSMCIDELKEHNAYLHMHTATHGAVDIQAMANQLGIPADLLRITDEAQYHTGLTEPEMVMIAQSSDCLIQPSRREGCCLPLLEYQVCGVPVIASDAHAQAEYNLGGFRITGERGWGMLGAWEFIPSIKSVNHNIITFFESLQFENKHVAQQRVDIATLYSKDEILSTHLPPLLEAIAMDVLERE